MKIGTLVRWRAHSDWGGGGQGIIVGERQAMPEPDEADSSEYKIHWIDGWTVAGTATKTFKKASR
jgi:hypothetical protein